MHASTINHNEEIQGRQGEWSILARGNQMVVVAWKASDDGLRVEGKVSSNRSSKALLFDLSVPGMQKTDSTMLPLGGIEVTLTLEKTASLESDDDNVALMCNLPLTEKSFFSDQIGAWSQQPEPDDVPDDASEIGIEGPHQAVNLFPFVWLHPPGLRELIDIDRRYITVESLGLTPAKLDLYEELASRTGSGAAAAKQQDAENFRLHGYKLGKYIAQLAELPPPLDRFPLLRAELECISGPIERDELLALVHLLLGQTVETFLRDPALLTAQGNVWQSLFALALKGAKADARLAVQLTDVLRLWHFLQLLDKDSGNHLGEQQVRHIVLRARPVFPDEVAALPPVPTIAGKGNTGNWAVLGVGTLKMARQRLEAYLPGELAEVVNVMPGERQEIQERIASSVLDNASSRGERENLGTVNRLSSATNELSDAVQEAMTADGVLRNLSNIHPSYNNLSLTVSGAAAEGEAASKWSGQDASRYLQQLTEQAAQQLGERISKQRGTVWQEFHERRQSNLIDNTSDGRLVGIYRWVDRLMRVHTEEAGRRLVLSFLVEQPARTWLDKIAGSGAVPPQKPLPLAAFKVPDGQGYVQVTAANYQSFGASYGLRELEPPPPQTRNVTLSCDRVGAADMTGLRIPDGYVAVSGQLTIGLTDSRYNLVCSVAGQSYSSAAAPKSQVILDTVVPAPVTAGTTVGDASVTSPVMPTAAISSFPLAQVKDASGIIPVTVMTAAPAFVVKIDMQCQRCGDGLIDQVFIAWQIRSYERLLLAYQDACRAYAGQLAERIGAASAGHGAEVQRNALKQACLELLAPDGNADPQDFRFLDPLLSWAAMSWHYESWPVGDAGSWPELVAVEATRPASEQLFKQFLQAASARILLPVQSGCEAWLLFYLQYGLPWVGDPGSAPATRSSVVLLEEIRAPEQLRVRNAGGALEDMPALLAPACPRTWTVRVPTSMLYLQNDASLPRFPAHRRPLPVNAIQPGSSE